MKTKIKNTISNVDKYCRMYNSIIKKVRTSKGDKWRVFPNEVTDDDYAVKS